MIDVADVADAAGEEGMEIENPVIISTVINAGTCKTQSFFITNNLLNYSYSITLG